MQLNQKLSIISILLSHHLTWHCSSINKDLHRCDHKTVFVIVARLKLFRNDNKNNFVIISVQVCANVQKYRNKTLSNNGLIIENIDLFPIHLAVPILFHEIF